jgi:hypothetical protein
VKEIVQPEEEGVVDGIAVIGSAIVFDMEAERRESGVLPEIQTAGDFEIRSVRRENLAVRILRVVVIIHEEKGVAPFVSVEAFKSRGKVPAIFPEVVKSLKIGLSLGSESTGGYRDGSEENRFNRHKYQIIEIVPKLKGGRI